MSEPGVFSEDMREIVESFVVETQEIFDALNDDLLLLEQAENPSVLIDQIFRAVHTVKGTSSFLSLDQLNLLAHHFEEVLNRMRKGKLAFRPEMMDVLFEAFDKMTVLLQQVLDHKLVELPLDGLLGELASLAAEDIPASAPDDATDQRDARHVAHQSARSSRTSVRVEVKWLDELLTLAGDLALTRDRIAKSVDELTCTHDVPEGRSELKETIAELDLLTTRIRDAVLKTRMIPIERVFSKFPRVVRDLGRSLDKEIEIAFRGEDTEIDKAIADYIGEPLLHLIRNAIDHGIESRNERLELGKPEEGRIILCAEQVGGHLLISVEDDGAGIEPDLLRRHAVDRTFLSPDEASKLRDDEAYNLIWTPGFTTTNDVNRMSGRGVGLDVVMTAATQRNGTVEIESVPGRGTKFTLRLPLTLAIVPCLLVRCGTQTFAFPVDGVEEVVDLAVAAPSDECLIRLDGLDLHPVHLADVLECASDHPVGTPPLIEDSPPFEGCNASHKGSLSSHNGAQDQSSRLTVVVNVDEARHGISIDHLEGREDLIVKPIENRADFGDVISGTAMLADGRRAMVLDTGALCRHATRAAEAST